MAIDIKLRHFLTGESFDKELEEGKILDTHICWIKDRQLIYTHQWGILGVPDGGKPDLILTLDEEGNLIWSDKLTDILTNVEKIEKDIYEEIDTNGHEYVDMGEAGIWATCNIGASKPEEYGLYFAWGETIGAPDAMSGKTFNWDGYKFGGGGPGVLGQSKYNSDDGLITLELEDDAAHVYMGGDWRMPTKDDVSKLLELCNSEYISDYQGTGVRGILFTLNTDETKKLFIPYADTYDGSGQHRPGYSARLWTSSLDNSKNEYSQESNSYIAYALYSVSTNQNIPEVNKTARHVGFSIRGFIPALGDRDKKNKKVKFYTKAEIDSRLSLKALNAISILYLKDWEHVEKVILNGIEYFPHTDKIIYREPTSVYCEIIPEEGYFVYGHPSKHDIFMGLGRKVTLTPKAGRSYVKIKITEGVEKITFNGIDYFEDTDLIVAPDTFLHWSCTLKEGYGIINTSDNYFTTSTDKTYEFLVNADKPTLKLEVNKGVLKIVLNDTDEYVKSEIIKIPYNSTITYKATAEEGYLLVDYLINWQTDYISGPSNSNGSYWHQESQEDSVDGQRWVCISPGTNGIVRIQCNFSGVNSITFKYRSDAESTYDYMCVGLLDTQLTKRTTDSSSVVDTTSGNLGIWREHTFNNLNKEQHFVQFLYGKDSSLDVQPDNAQVYISSIDEGLSKEISNSIVCDLVIEYKISPVSLLINDL